jgi:RHS repeat-associated protein
MVSCTLPNNGGTTTFTYGADGLRRSMTNSAGVTTDYIYDGSMLVREMQVAGPNNFPSIAAGTLVDTATYLQGPTGPSYRRNDITGIPSWYVYNGLGSVVGEVDPAGNYTASGEYDVYGAPRASTQSGTFDTRQRYVGQLGHQTDPETGGLIYMQARYYDPGTGRFISEDPELSGLNWFIYCDDSPINYVDAKGTDDLGSIGVAETGAMELEGITALADLDATFVGTQDGAAYIYVDLVQGEGTGFFGIRGMLTAIRGWATGQGLVGIYIGGIAGTAEGARLFQIALKVIDAMGDSGSLVTDGPTDWIYWVFQS